MAARRDHEHPKRRARRRANGLPNWRIVRYADDFVVLVHGSGDDVAAQREDIADVLAPLGLRLSESKTHIVHMSEWFDFLGFRIKWKRKRGTNTWHVYTFIADRPIRSLKAKIRALTSRLSQQPPRAVLTRINQIVRGWANYFKHAVCKHTMDALDNFVWHRVIRWWKKLHRWRWKDVRRHLTGPGGRWRRPSADGIVLFNIASVSITRHRYRGYKIPNPWTLPTTPNDRHRGEPVASKGARRVWRAAWGNGPGAIPAPRPRPTQPQARWQLIVPALAIRISVLATCMM